MIKPRVAEWAKAGLGSALSRLEGPENLFGLQIGDLKEWLETAVKRDQPLA